MHRVCDSLGMNFMTQRHWRMNYHKTRQDRMVKMSLRERKAFNKFVLIPHSGRLSHD